MRFNTIYSPKYTLWSIQPVSLYEELLEKGELSTFGSSFANADPKHLYGYEWLIEQMRERIGDSPQPNQYPFWAWFQWQNFNQRKPDMRSYYLEKGEKNVRLTLEIDSKDVLLSDFIEWHNVFSYQTPVIGDTDFIKSIPDDDLPYLGYSEELFPDLSERHQNIIKSTWPNIFNLNIGKSWHSKPIQATFWNLKLSQVKKVEYFTGRKKF